MRKISSAEATKRWRERHPERARKTKREDRERRVDREREIKRRSYYRTKYGLTEQEYNALLQQPCAICNRPSEVVDHCHVKGHVRSALCHRCNRSLGNFNDDPALLRRAAEYLEES